MHLVQTWIGQRRLDFGCPLRHVRSEKQIRNNADSLGAGAQNFLGGFPISRRQYKRSAASPVHAEFGSPSDRSPWLWVWFPLETTAQTRCNRLLLFPLFAPEPTYASTCRSDNRDLPDRELQRHRNLPDRRGIRRHRPLSADPGNRSRSAVLQRLWSAATWPPHISQFPFSDDLSRGAAIISTPP